MLVPWHGASAIWRWLFRSWQDPTVWMATPVVRSRLMLESVTHPIDRFEWGGLLNPGSDPLILRWGHGASSSRCTQGTWSSC